MEVGREGDKMGRKKKDHYGVEPITECYCPKCEKTHRTFLNWQGRGKPKIICYHCKKTQLPDERTHALNTKALKCYLQESYREDRILY